MRYKQGDKVVYNGVNRTINYVNGNGTYDLSGGQEYIPENKLGLPGKKITLGGYECTYSTYGSKLSIYFRNHTFSTTYFGKVSDFLASNEGLIAGFFITKVDEEVDVIMKEFTNNFASTLVKLKELVMPNTKDLLLTRVIETFKGNIKDVAELFSDSSIRNTLINLFK